MAKCEICLAEDDKYFAFNNGKIYCRRCITFKGEKAKINNSSNNEVILDLKYNLSKKQEEISSNVLKAFINHQNVLINAVCGSGKTELVYKTIEYCLKHKLQVGFAIPRKDVVIDLFPRLKDAFPHQKVISIYGGHTNNLSGDIIILTTHQLYRFENYFDLLILDEVDAFPFYNNQLLNTMFKKSVKGNYIMMSATSLDNIKEEIIKQNGLIFTLNKRYHNHPLPVPTIKEFFIGKNVYLIYKLNKFLKCNKPTLIFVPTIKICERLYMFLNVFFKNGECVHSQKKNREEIIENFKKNKVLFLVTTSILERGVTIKNLQVIVYNADNYLFDSKALIQIAGRVGRKIDAYDGEVVFLGGYNSTSMQEAKRKILQANK